MHDLAKVATKALRIDLQLVLDFFIIYSRFEYAAKDNYHVEKSTKIIDLKFMQSSVAQVVEEEFLNKVMTDVNLAEAVEYYESFPPKKQVWNNGPDWRETNQTESRCTQLLISVSRARNNLFHGGKGFAPEAQEIGRDEALLRHGITIIDAILNCDIDLHSSFNSYQ